MNHLANALFKQDFNIYVVIVFIVIGFFAGFFLKVNSQKEKKHILKMEKDADANKSRIAGLKEKIEDLEKENRAMGGTNPFS